MNKGFFWKNWEISYRIPYLLLLSLFFLSFTSYLALYFIGADWFYNWEVAPDLEGVNFKIDDVNIGAFQIPLETPLFVIEEYFKVSNLTLPLSNYYIFGAVLILVFTLWLSIFVEVKNWAYGLGMAVFALLLASFNFELLGLGVGFSNSFLVVALLLFLMTSYVFQTFFLKVHFWIRWGAFLLITLGLGLWVAYGSSVQHPAVFLVNFGIIVPVVMTFAFILFNAHEVLRTFWYVLVHYNEQGGPQNIKHFSIISVIYIANIALILGEYQGWWSLDIYKLDLFILMALSSILGLWGFQARNEGSAWSKFIPFAPVGAYLFLILGIVCFSTLSFFFATSNDSMIDAFRILILYTHFGLGLTFFMYVLANFVPLARDFVSLEGMIYQGKIITMQMMYLFGLGISISMFVGANNVSWFLVKGGYYMGIGDSYLLEKDYQMAGISYKVAHNENDFIGHRVNFMLASIAEEIDERSLRLKYLRDGLLRSPTPYGYIEISNILREEDRKLDAMFVLRDGLKRFPDNLQMNNNIAMLYKANKVIDSSFYYLEKAEWAGGSNPIAQNNLWAVLAQNPSKGIKLNDLPEVKQIKNNQVGWANKTALFTNFLQAIKLQDFQTDSTQITEANDASFAFTYNYALNQAHQPNSKAVSLLNGFMAKDTMRVYGYNPHFARAVNLYYSGQVQGGIQALASLGTLPEDSYLNVVAGLWLLEQQAYGSALSYFNTAKNLGNTEAIFYKAITLSEMRDFAQAIPIWIEISQAKGKHAKEANQILNVLKDKAELTTDLDKFNFIHYQSRLTSLENLLAVYGTIQNPDNKVRAAGTLMLECIRTAELSQAESLFKNLNIKKGVSQYSQSLLNFAYCKLLIAQGKYAQLLQDIDKLAFVRIHRNYKPYFKALSMARTGSTQDLEANYLKARQATPFDEEIILDLADYYFNRQRNVEKAYLIVVDGVRSNPFSLALQKNYALLALEIGLDFYGDKALEKIQELSTEEDFQKFKATYNERKIKLEEQRKALLGN